MDCGPRLRSSKSTSPVRDPQPQGVARAAAAGRLPGIPRDETALRRCRSGETDSRAGAARAERVQAHRRRQCPARRGARWPRRRRRTGCSAAGPARPTPCRRPRAWPGSARRRRAESRGGSRSSMRTQPLAAHVRARRGSCRPRRPGSQNAGDRWATERSARGRESQRSRKAGRPEGRKAGRISGSSRPGRRTAFRGVRGVPAPRR